MANSLAGTIAPVTAASRGIGRAIAHKLAMAGCEVGINLL
jgi:NAD(P)-dependent dehydrogenase (short-subunit alcohol dehydrogenase family)